MSIVGWRADACALRACAREECTVGLLPGDARTHARNGLR